MGSKVSSSRIQLAKQRVADALFSATQRKVFGVLLKAPTEGLFGNEILAAAKAGNGAVQRELTRLVEAGLVVIDEVGGRKRYRLDRSAPVYGPLREVFAALDPTSPVPKVADDRGAYASGGNKAPVPRCLRRLPINLPELAALCLSNNIVRLGFFGSVTRDDFRADSDVDVLVEFANGETTLDGLMVVQDWLMERTGRKVDVVTPSVLRNPHRKASIERDLEVVYLAP